MVLPTVPESWSDTERKLYLDIGKRKKSEHVLGYSVVSVGVQLFHHITILEKDKEKRREAGLDESSESCEDVPQSYENSDGISQITGDTEQEA
jgi:hypothetical protein